MVSDFAKYDPSLQAVYETYHGIADAISNICRRLMPIQEYLHIAYDIDVLPVNYNEWLCQNGHERLQKVLEKVYAPLVAYTVSLRKQYKMLYGVEAKAALNKFIMECEEFEEGCQKILYFRDIDYNITSTLENEYFNCATICQLRMVDGLKRRACEFVNDIIAGIVTTHMAENDSICDEFEEIAARAIKDPGNAAELVEQGVYILHAKSVLVEALKVRITRQIQITSALIEITELSQEHVESNARTVNWLKKIKPIFDKNAAAFEAHKAEMEDNLKC